LVGVAQLMIVLDVTIVNIALPSAQVALHFSTDDRQWIITAYALTFGSLLLLGGKLGDLLGRKWTFMAGLLGFAVDWRFISLRLINSEVDYDSHFPAGYEEARAGSGREPFGPTAAISAAELRHAFEVNVIAPHSASVLTGHLVGDDNGVIWDVSSRSVIRALAGRSGIPA
jgi:MFS family permease